MRLVGDDEAILLRWKAEMVRLAAVHQTFVASELCVTDHGSRQIMLTQKAVPHFTQGRRADNQHAKAAINGERTNNIACDNRFAQADPVGEHTAVPSIEDADRALTADPLKLRQLHCAEYGLRFVVYY